MSHATPVAFRLNVLPWLLASSLTLLAAPAARAQAPDQDEDLLWAARICYLEASWRESDCTALLWVARKRARRAGHSWFNVLRRYSAIRAHTARAQDVREYPWGDVPGKPDSFNRRWERLRNLVVEFNEGKHADPCPRAVHWGGSMDHPHGRMIPARCAVLTANTFYALSH
jgi:hypothetical protein